MTGGLGAYIFYSGNCAVVQNSLTVKKKIWCGTHTTFSYLTLQYKNILLSALHSYSIFIFYAL